MNLNIYQRINEIRKKVSYAQKDRTVSGGGSYKAVSHDAVTALLRNHLIDHGIVIVPMLVESKVVDTGQTTQGGTPMIRYEARYDVAFVNVDDPTDRIVVALDAHANDFGDKAPGKATSYATKYAMLKLFSIETGEDEEGRVEGWIAPEARQPVTEEQVEDLQKLIGEVVKDQAKFADWLTRAVGTHLLDQIPARKFDIVKKQLESMRRPKKAANDPAP